MHTMISSFNKNILLLHFLLKFKMTTICLNFICQRDVNQAGAELCQAHFKLGQLNQLQSAMLTYQLCKSASQLSACQLLCQLDKSTPESAFVYIQLPPPPPPHLSHHCPTPLHTSPDLQTPSSTFTKPTLLSNLPTFHAKFRYAGYSQLVAQPAMLACLLLGYDNLSSSAGMLPGQLDKTGMPTDAIFLVSLLSYRVGGWVQSSLIYSRLAQNVA